MEYASSAWIGATPTSLAQLDSIQNRAKGVIGLPKYEYEDHRIQPLSHRRAFGAATLFHRMFYEEALELLCQLMPNIHVHDPRLRWSVRSHDLAVKVPRSNLVSHARSFLPSTAQLWNSLPAQIPAIRSRASFSREVNRFLGANSSAASKWFFFVSAVDAQLCHVIKDLKKKKIFPVCIKWNSLWLYDCVIAGHVYVYFFISEIYARNWIFMILSMFYMPLIVK